MEVSSPSGNAKYSYALSQISRFYDLETSRIFGVRNSNLTGKGTEVFKGRMDEADTYSL